MSEIPSEFFNKKSFQSLPRLAFLTWFIVFIIDAVVLQRFPYSFARVVYIWVLGMIVSFLFELARYKNMDTPEKGDYKKYFLLLNAFIIFLYYTGLTKQIGAWGELKSTINEKGQKPNESAILLEVQEWAIPVLARQTSYFPDVTAIAENNKLKAQNNMLRDSLTNMGNGNMSKQIPDLTGSNATLKQQIISLKRSLDNCEKNLSKSGLNSNKDETLATENQRLRDEYNRLNEYNRLMNTQIETLKQRINAFNRKQSEWPKITGQIYDSDIRGMITKATKDSNFFNFLFYTPIDVTLPNIQQKSSQK